MSGYDLSVTSMGRDVCVRCVRPQISTFELIEFEGNERLLPLT